MENVGEANRSPNDEHSLPLNKNEIRHIIFYNLAFVKIEAEIPDDINVNKSTKIMSAMVLTVSADFPNILYVNGNNSS